ncbi:MAG TPA: tetratricopeptide repeat protein, partial [Pyrinomonadaceae bacterium]|nr:tetratricopeptide repeat protein [Pyrinomonadaceae bacterium]
MFHAELSRVFLFLLFLSIAVSAQNFTETHSVIRSAVENKDYQTAVTGLQNLERSDKKIFTLNNYDYLLARMAEKQGDFAAATAYYQAVAERDSVLSAYAMWHLSQIFRSSGNLFLERAYLQKLLTLAPESLVADAAKTRLLRSHFESKDYQTVLNQLSLVGGKKPSTTNEVKGQKAADEGLSRENSVLLGQAYLQSGKANEAQEVFTKLINNLPNPAQPDDFALAGAKALDEMAVGRDNFGKTVPTLADAEHFRRAQIYQFNRSFALSRLHYQAIIKTHPTSSYVADALYQTGRGYAQERNFDEAINWFERVQAEFPDQSIARDALSQAAAAYSRVNKPKEAISRYQKFIGKYADADNLDRAYLNIIDVLRDTGSSSEALKWTAKTQEVFRGKLPEALALFAQARIHISQNDWASALNDLNNLQNFSDLGGTRVAGGTNKTEVLFLKGFVLENLNRYAEAIDVYLSIPDGR